MNESLAQQDPIGFAALVLVCSIMGGLALSYILCALVGMAGERRARRRVRDILDGKGK